MFREEKSPEDEIKAWQFWHGRQHSVKQRILDAGELHKSARGVTSVDLTEVSRNWTHINKAFHFASERSDPDACADVFASPSTDGGLNWAKSAGIKRHVVGIKDVWERTSRLMWSRITPKKACVEIPQRCGSYTHSKCEIIDKRTLHSAASFFACGRSSSLNWCGKVCWCGARKERHFFATLRSLYMLMIVCKSRLSLLVNTPRSTIAWWSTRYHHRKREIWRHERMLHIELIAPHKSALTL